MFPGQSCTKIPCNQFLNGLRTSPFVSFVCARSYEQPNVTRVISLRESGSQYIILLKLINIYLSFCRTSIEGRNLHVNWQEPDSFLLSQDGPMRCWTIHTAKREHLGVILTLLAPIVTSIYFLLTISLLDQTCRS